VSVANSILKKPKQNFRRKSEENENKKISGLSTEKVKIFFTFSILSIFGGWETAAGSGIFS
jgi:hypothetical protein